MSGDITGWSCDVETCVSVFVVFSFGVLFDLTVLSTIIVVLF